MTAKRLFRQGFWYSLALIVAAATMVPGTAKAVGDASTYFQIFVPANNDAVGRDVALIVTNVSPFTATVDIIDDDEDGDDDDTALGVVLERGQSWVRFIKDGAVNDDAGGKWDGDYFIISSDYPVVVQMATKSDWQWDFAPADNKTMRGQSFFLYSAPTSFSQRDLNLVAYEDNTEIQVFDITVSPLSVSGITTVDLDQPVEVLKVVLNEGEDLIGRRGLGIDIFDPGRTYWVRASKGVTCQYGSLVGNARDGGAFVPSENGFAAGDKFYFYIPRDFGDEREVRIVSFDDDNQVILSGWDNQAGDWVTIQQYTLQELGHGDWVESGTNYPMYRLTCTPGKKVSVFAASWLEAKGLSGTKDIASFASSATGYGAGKQFNVYVPQPGRQGNLRWDGRRLGDASLLYVFGHVDGTEITVVDAHTGGTLFSKTATIQRGRYVAVRMSPAEFSALNKPEEGLRPYLKLTSNHLVTVMVSNHNDNWMTFAPSVVLPNPVLDVTAAASQAVVGGELCLLVAADNEGAGALEDARMVVALDPGSRYVTSSFTSGAPGEPVVTIDPATGGEVLTWSGFTIDDGGRLEGSICVEVLSRRPDGTPVRNRELLSFPVVVSGDGYGVPPEAGGFPERFTAQSSAVLSVDDSNQTTVSGLSATPVGNMVDVRWATGREPDLEGFRVYRSRSGDGPFTLLTPSPIPGVGDAVSGDRYGYQDNPPSTGVTYYYRLELVLNDGGNAFYGPVAVLAEDRTPPPAPVIDSVEVGDGTVRLDISGADQDGDLRGYLVYRAPAPGGPYTRINELPVLPGARATDPAVGNGMTYTYRARGIDTSGNVSEDSNTVEAVLPATVGHAYTLAYEDQVGPGKNDWDYNDWVVAIESTEEFSNGGVSSVSVRMEALARGARYRNAFRLRYRAEGPWRLVVTIFQDRDSGTVLERREESGTGTIDTLIYQDTNAALPPEPGEDFTNTLNRQDNARLGQVVVVEIDVLDPGSNPSTLRHRPPFDPYLVNQAGSVHLRSEGHPDSTEVVTFWPDSPLLGTHLDYVLKVPGTGWYWPLENQKIWDAYPGVFADHVLSGGTEEPDWWLASNRNPARTYNWYPFDGTERRTVSGVRVADESVLPLAEWVASLGTGVSMSPKGLRYGGEGWLPDSLAIAGADGRIRMLDAGAAPRPGWPVNANSFRAVPAVGRIEPGHAFPTLMTAEERYDGAARVMAWELAEEPSMRWEYEVGAPVKGPLVLVDLDGDGWQELLALTTAGELWVIGADGQPMSGSPVSLGTPLWNDKNILASGGPVVVDMDDDGRPEILVAGPASDSIHGFDANLDPLPGWPRSVPGAIVGGVAVAHHPGTASLALFCATADGLLLGMDQYGRALPGFPVDLGGNVTVPVVAFAEFEDLSDTIVVPTTDGRVHLVGTDGVARPGWPRTAGSEVLAPAVVGDLDGDAEMEILVGSRSGDVYAWNLDGTLAEEFCFRVDGAIQSSPLLADFDGDARLEAYVITARGDLYRAEGTGQTPLPLSMAIGWAGSGGGSEPNTPDAARLFYAPVPLATGAPQILPVLLGLADPQDLEVDCDVNFDGVIDSADLGAIER